MKPKKTKLHELPNKETVKFGTLTVDSSQVSASTKVIKVETDVFLVQASKA